jgi:hypothetical protein
MNDANMRIQLIQYSNVKKTVSQIQRATHVTTIGGALKIPGICGTELCG